MAPLLASRSGVSAQGYGLFRTISSTTSYESIATATGTGSSGTITFSSIPQTYTSLQIRAIMRRSGAGANFYQSNLTLNSDTGNNYAQHGLFGDGATAQVEAYASGGYAGILLTGTVAGAGLAASITGTLILDIHNYTSTTQNKTIRSFSGGDANGTGRVVLNSGLWLSNAAISTITLNAVTGNFTTDSTFALYGIKGA